MNSHGLEIRDNIYAYLKGRAIDTDFDSVKISGNKLYWIESDGYYIITNEETNQVLD